MHAAAADHVCTATTQSTLPLGLTHCTILQSVLSLRSVCSGFWLFVCAAPGKRTAWLSEADVDFFTGGLAAEGSSGSRAGSSKAGSSNPAELLQQRTGCCFM